MVFHQLSGVEVAQGVARAPILASRLHPEGLHQDVMRVERLDLVVVARRLGKAGPVAAVGDFPQFLPRVLGVQSVQFLVDGAGRGAATVSAQGGGQQVGHGLDLVLRRREGASVQLQVAGQYRYGRYGAEGVLGTDGQVLLHGGADDDAGARRKTCCNELLVKAPANLVLGAEVTNGLLPGPTSAGKTHPAPETEPAGGAVGRRHSHGGTGRDVAATGRRHQSCREMPVYPSPTSGEDTGDGWPQSRMVPVASLSFSHAGAEFVRVSVSVSSPSSRVSAQTATRTVWDVSPGWKVSVPLAAV